MDKKWEIGTILFLLIGIVGFIIADNNKQFISPHILTLTSPITSITGVVEKIEGSIVFVKFNNLTYKANITNSTHIERITKQTPFLFKTNTASGVTKVRLDDIRVGDAISLIGTADLRTLRNLNLTPSHIQLPELQTRVTGKVVQNNKQFIIIRAALPLKSAIAPTKESEVKIAVTDGTEISRMSNKLVSVDGQQVVVQKPEKLSIDELIKDMEVTVYTESDLTQGNTFTALRIEPAAPSVSMHTPAASTGSAVLN